MKRTIFAVALMLIASASLAANLKVKIRGVQSDQGYIMIALYDQKDAYMDLDRSVAAKQVRAQKGVTVVTFPDIESGTYAVTLYHDENENEKLDKNFFGIPKEGYGFSNNARGFAGAPAFSAAAIDVQEEEKAVTIFLSY